MHYTKCRPKSRAAQAHRVCLPSHRSCQKVALDSNSEISDEAAGPRPTIALATWSFTGNLERARNHRGTLSHLLPPTTGRKKRKPAVLTVLFSRPYTTCTYYSTCTCSEPQTTTVWRCLRYWRLVVPLEYLIGRSTFSRRWPDVLPISHRFRQRYDLPAWCQYSITRARALPNIGVDQGERALWD